MKRPTIHDVAREAGGCAATVSRVMRGAPDVGEDYRERVTAAVERLGYRPQMGAQAIRRGNTRLIGLLMPGMDLETFALSAEGVLREAAALGYSVVMMTSEGSSAVEQERLRALSGLPLDGLIIRPVAHASVFADARALTGLPVVGMGIPAGDTGVPAMYSGGPESAHLAARYLLRIGRRRIAMTVPFREDAVSDYGEFLRLAQHDPAQIGVARYHGYRNALEEAGVAFDPSLLLYSGYTREDGRQAAQALLSLDEPADAMICANDEAALGAMGFLAGQGVAVPQQVSLIGFDDSVICRACRPTLTSVSYGSRETGRRAMAALDKLIRGEALAPEDLSAKMTLIIRDSTCAPAAKTE